MTYAEKVLKQYSRALVRDLLEKEKATQFPWNRAFLITARKHVKYLETIVK